MQSELSDFVYLVAALEKAAGSLVPQVMEAQILNSQQVAGARKRGPNALGIVGKNVFARLGLCGDKRPGFGRVLEPAMIAVFAGRVLCVADHTGLRGFVVVAPFQPADFRFPPRRGDSEVHDGSHGDRCAPVAALEMFAQPGEFVSGRPSRSLAGLADQAEFAAGGARLLDDLGTHRKLPDALGGPQNNTYPDQVVDHCCGSSTFHTARLHMPDQVGVVYGLGLARFLQTSFLSVENTKAAVQVVEAPDWDEYTQAATKPRSGKRGRKGRPEDDDVEASL